MNENAVKSRVYQMIDALIFSVMTLFNQISIIHVN